MGMSEFEVFSMAQFNVSYYSHHLCMLDATCWMTTTTPNSSHFHTMIFTARFSHSKTLLWFTRQALGILEKSSLWRGFVLLWTEHLS